MKTLILIQFFLFSTFGFAQNEKILHAKKIDSKITIDGIATEPAWKNSITSSNFIQTVPNPEKECTQKTEIQLIYDNENIYVFATLFEVNSDSITKTLSARDETGNADIFGIVLDTYGSSTSGFGFLVTAAGVQIDEIHTPNSIDRNWNAVWESKAVCLEDKWVVEMKIPFAAIRFPNVKKQQWRANFTRHIRRNREDANWNYFDATKLNYLSQFGKIEGIEGIESPIRLSLFPYVSGYFDVFDKKATKTFNGGLDLKYGINDAFTIDMTLVPDFGQVQFDDQVLNLSPFEIRFNEFRQFFTEGIEIFNKGDLFYSRRIGSQPINTHFLSNIDSTDQITELPNTTQLINATKFSGRTKSGLGIGVFNGITKATHAKIVNSTTGIEREVEISPLTNYNVIVLDQNLKHNSSISLVNTNVLRNGSAYDANATAFLIDLYDKSEKYHIYGNASNSQLFKTSNTEIGQKYNVSLGKVSGAFLAELSTEILDDKFNTNDLGFLARNNYKNVSLETAIRTFSGFWKFIRAWSELNIDYTRLYNPDDFTQFEVYSEVGIAFKNFLFAGINATGMPIDEHDYFEPRTPGLFYKRPGGFELGGFLSSNYAKSFAYDIRGGFLNRTEANRYEWDLSLSPRYRFTDKLSTVFTVEIENYINDIGLALTNNFQVVSIDNSPVFGKRNRTDLTNLLSINYIFNNKMNISFRARHYWSKVTYFDFYTLAEDGSVEAINYLGIDDKMESKHNNNFNIFTIDMSYSWVFAPGSFLSLVWKQSLTNSNLYTSLNYFDNINNLAQSPALNSISLKLLYYISTSNFKKIKRSD